MSYGGLLRFVGIREDELRPLCLPICSFCSKYIFERGVEESTCGHPLCMKPREKENEPQFQYFDLKTICKSIVNDPFYRQHLSYAYKEFSEKYGKLSPEVTKAEPEFYYDFYDGSKMRNLFAKFGVDAFKNVLFFSMVTDGISLSKRANNSVIPIILRLHNLPPWLRAKFLGSFTFGIVPARASAPASQGGDDGDGGTSARSIYLVYIDQSSKYIIL